MANEKLELMLIPKQKKSYQCPATRPIHEWLLSLMPQAAVRRFHHLMVSYFQQWLVIDINVHISDIASNINMFFMTTESPIFHHLMRINNILQLPDNNKHNPF